MPDVIRKFNQILAPGTPLTFRSYLLLKAQAKVYVRDTQIRLILNPVVNELFTAFRSKISIENHLAQITAMLRETSPLKPGYTGGNICNLLLQMGTDLSSYDFSYLTVWQADLQRADLRSINFAHADLSRSVFTETFGCQIFREHTGAVWSAAFSSDSQTLVSGSGDQTVKLWDIATGHCLTLLGHNNEVMADTFGSQGKTLYSGAQDETIKLWDVETGLCLRTLQGYSKKVWSIALSSNALMGMRSPAEVRIKP